MLASEACPGGFSSLGAVPGQHYNLSTCSEGLRSTIEGQTLQPLPRGIEGMLRRTFIKTWMDVVENYTNRNLTNGRDKLPAISALARKAFSTRRSCYLAGIWKDDLVYELGWISELCTLPAERSENASGPLLDIAVHDRDSIHTNGFYRAPSWSWASLDGEVIYPYNDDNIGSGSNHSLIEYVDHEIELSNDDDPYGQVKGDHLIVKAQTIEITARPLKRSGPQIMNTGMSVSVNGYTLSTQTTFCRDENNGMDWPDPHNVLAMPLLLSVSPPNKFFFIYLLLEKVADGYKRVGALTVEAKRSNLKRDDGLKEILYRLGRIDWDARPSILFERDSHQFQKIRII